MSDHHFSKYIGRELQGIVTILPLVILAVVCTLILGPVLISGASSSFQSPLSPISPLKPPAEATGMETPQPEKVLPPKQQTVQPEETPTPSPTVTATATMEVTEEPPQQVPPPISPTDIEAESSTPPTLWVIIGLVVVGGIVAALIVFKKK